MHVANITIDNTKVAADLTDFPVYINLADLPASFWDTIVDTTIESKLIAYWQLESTADSKGSYTLTNNNTVTFTSGLVDNAGTFNGSNQSLNNNSVWGASSYPRSYFGWVKFDTVASGGDQSIFAIGDGSVHYYTLKLRDSDNKIVFRSNNNTDAGDVDTGITASASTWYFVGVVQHSATSVSLYVNNTKTNTTATTFSATVSQFYMGYLGRSSAWFLDGQIDEAGFCNGALTDDDMLLLYNSGAGRKGHLLRTGGDIRVFKSDGTTELPREVVSCDTSTETGELHFKYSGTLSGSVDTVVQIHADGTSADYAPTDTYGRNNVWVSSYKLVHHMQNTSATDSTSNSLNGTLVSMDATNIVDGKLAGKGYDFDGTADYVTRGTDDASLDFGSTAFNISFWLNSDVNSPHVLSKKLADVDGGYEIFDVSGGTTYFRIRQSGASKDYTKTSLIASTDGWTMYHFLGSPATGGDIYKNGTLVSLTSDAGTYTSIQNTANPFMYGRAEARGYLNGKMDELRIYSGALLSADWITTEYNNQNSPSTFYTASSPVTRRIFNIS